MRSRCCRPFPRESAVTCIAQKWQEAKRNMQHDEQGLSASTGKKWHTTTQSSRCSKNLVFVMEKKLPLAIHDGAAASAHVLNLHAHCAKGSLQGARAGGTHTCSTCMCTVQDGHCRVPGQEEHTHGILSIVVHPSFDQACHVNGAHTHTHTHACGRLLPKSEATKEGPLTPTFACL